MSPMRTEGRIYAPKDGGNSLAWSLEQALKDEAYVPWTTPLPALYVPQTNELQLTSLSESGSWEVLTMANPADIHKWCLSLSRIMGDIPLISTYSEPNGFWNGKLFVAGKPHWKTRNELDREVPYPIPLLNEENGLRSLQSYPVLSGGEAHGAMNTLGEDSVESFLRTFGLPAVLPEGHRKREKIWLEKESPLVINRVKE